jgi:hypothetical protein
MTGLKLRVPDEEDLAILIPGPVVISGKRLRLLASEKARLEAAARLILKKGYPVPLPEALNIIDG